MAGGVRNRVKLFSVVAGLFLFSACADTVKATPDEITIVQGFSVTEHDPANRIAQEHCAQFKKSAVLTIRTGRIVRYACVPRP
jgi:hypothetical protein